MLNPNPLALGHASVQFALCKESQSHDDKVGTTFLLFFRKLCLFALLTPSLTFFWHGEQINGWYLLLCNLLVAKNSSDHTTFISLDLLEDWWLVYVERSKANIFVWIHCTLRYKRIAYCPLIDFPVSGCILTLWKVIKYRAKDQVAAEKDMPVSIDCVIN